MCISYSADGGASSNGTRTTHRSGRSAGSDSSYFSSATAMVSAIKQGKVDAILNAPPSAIANLKADKSLVVDTASDVRPGEGERPTQRGRLQERLEPCGIADPVHDPAVRSRSLSPSPTNTRWSFVPRCSRPWGGLHTHGAAERGPYPADVDRHVLRNATPRLPLGRRVRPEAAHRCSALRVGRPRAQDLRLSGWHGRAPRRPAYPWAR